jgi:hypothetical protein
MWFAPEGGEEQIIVESINPPEGLQVPDSIKVISA